MFFFLKDIIDLFFTNVSFVLVLRNKLHLFENAILFEESTASIRGCSLKARIFKSTTAAIEAFYCNPKLHFLKGMPGHFQDTLQKIMFLD